MRRRFTAALAGALLIILTVAPATVSAANATGINVTLPVGGQITGFVKTKATTPAAMSTTVTATPTTSAGFELSADTNASTGAFTIKGLQLGATYILTVDGDATHPGGWWTSANSDKFTQDESKALATGAVTASLNVGTMLVAAGFTISGTIKGGTTGLVGMSVSLSGTMYTDTMTTSGGAFSFKNLPAGSYYIGIDPTGSQNWVGGYYLAGATGSFSPSIASPIVLGPSKTGLVITLPAGKQLKGTLQNAAGTGLVGVDVYFSNADGSGSRTTTTGTGGAFTINGIPAGAWGSVSVDQSATTQSGYYKAGATGNFVPTVDSATATAVTVGASGLLLPTIKAAALIAVTGYVKTTASVALPGVDVYAGNDSATTDAAGKYVLHLDKGETGEISVYPTGNYQQGFFASGQTGNFSTNRSLATSVDITAAKTLATIQVPVGLKIKGVVKTSSGAAAAYHSVTALLACGSSSCDKAYGSTDGTGAFLLSGLVPGTYTVYVDSGSETGGWFDSATATTRLTWDDTAADAHVLSTAAPLWDIGIVKTSVPSSISGTIKGNLTTPVGLVGAIVTACDSVDYCYGTSTVSTAGGAYTITGLDPGWYAIMVQPAIGANYESGYRKAGATPNFTRTPSLAQMVCVGSGC